jgi:hypothetical protein
LKSDDEAVEALRHAACRAARQGAHANETLALAVLQLQERNPEAGALFAAIARRYDVRDAWMGAAVSYHIHGAGSEAAAALVQALSKYAYSTIPRLVGDIAASDDAYGWAVLYTTGRVVIRLQRRGGGAQSPVVSMDGSPLALSSHGRGRFSVQLPAGWRRRTELRISSDYGRILGSVIHLKEIARIEGFADTLHGNLQGWAWCPNDPDCDPVPSVAA